MFYKNRVKMIAIEFPNNVLKQHFVNTREMEMNLSDFNCFFDYVCNNEFEKIVFHQDYQLYNA